MIRAARKSPTNSRCSALSRSASVIAIPVRSKNAVHNDPPAFLPLKADPTHLLLALRTARSCLVDRVCRRETGGITDGRYETGVWRRRRDRRQQHAAFGDVFFTATVPVTTEATCLCVAFRKYVQTPATHEFGASQPDRFDLIIAASLLTDSRQKRHESVFMRHDATIGNRTTRQIPSQIFCDLLGRTVFVGRRFDVRHPRDRFQWLEPGVKRGFVRQEFPVSGEMEFAARM